MKRVLAGILLVSTLLVACSAASAPSESGARPAPAGAATAAPASAPTSAAARAGVLPAAAPPAADAKAAGGAQEAAASGSTQPASSQPPPAPTPASAPPAADQRMIVYTTSLTLLVTDFYKSIDDVGTVATSLGGFVAGVEQHIQDENPSAIVRLKVPAQNYQAAMNRLRSNGIDARDEQTTTQDVTEDYNDAKNEIASLEATYNQYLELMKQAKTVDEILKLQERIDEVKLQLDKAKGRAQFLEQQSALATITVTLRPAQQVLVQEYGVLLSQKRNLEIQQAQILTQLQNAKLPPEQEAALRDRLNQIVLQLTAVGQRLDAVRQIAQRGSVQLPTDDLGAQAQPTQSTASADELRKQYLQTRVDVRRAELEQERLLRLIHQTPPPANLDELRGQLTQNMLDLQKLREQLSDIEARASQRNIQLPEVDASLLAALVSGQPERGRLAAAIQDAWDASLQVLSDVGIGLLQVAVFFWWLIVAVVVLALVVWRFGLARRPFRRTPAPPAPPVTPSAPSTTPLG